ncbi:iron transporter [Deferribacterales bacterium RsTz2092]
MLRFLSGLFVVAVMVIAPMNASAQKAPSPSAAPKGFQEFPLGEEYDNGPLHISAVYFQPVDMLPVGKSLPAAQSDMHLEADISARANNNLGYGAGDFVPGLTVRYTITKNGSPFKLSGTFMPMNASDGPHYGANIKLDGAGRYKVTIAIESPEKQGYLLHVDRTTGVTGRYWTKPIEASWTLHFVPRKW